MARRQPPHKTGRLTFFSPAISDPATACDAKLATISAALGGDHDDCQESKSCAAKGKWRHVSTWDDGRINSLRGHYTVADGLITVMSQHGTKTIHVEGLPPAVLAKIVLRELAADRGRQC
jgi:hypothetical protein